MSKLIYPRDLAIRVLTSVLSDHKTLEQAIDEVWEKASTRLTGSPSARGWLNEVCSGTLRWRGRLDLAIDATALHKKPSGWLRKALLIAAYQLIVQERIAPGAVVSETVDEVRKREGEAPARFANASLRKIADHATEWRNLPAPNGTDAESAARASLPSWFWKRLVEDHGADWAWRYSVASLDRPVLWLRARRPDWEPVVPEKAIPAERGPVSGSWKLTTGGIVPELAGFSDGEFFVQDISSQRLVGEICEWVKRECGEHPLALDLCAAPGGKSIGMHWNGMRVFSSDRDPARLKMLAQSLKRVGADQEVRVIPRNEVKGLPPQDLVWVDAPCTGSGILRRHPEVRWLRQEKELAELARVQRDLLLEAWGLVRPGGFLAYSVCSVFKEEGPSRIEEVGLPAQTARSWFLMPQEGPHGDGFWAVLLRKS